MATTAPRPVLFRLAMLSALVGVQAVLGCQPAPSEPDVKPSTALQSTSLTASPTSTAAPSSTAALVVASLPPFSPSSAPGASADPTVIASSDPLPVTLATPSVDTDLSSDDETSLETLLDSDAIKALLPATLIHDGGVILFHTLGLLVASRPTAAATGAATPATVATAASAPARTACTGPLTPPEGWARTATEKGGRQLKIRKVAGHPTQATAVVTWQNRGAITYSANGKKYRNNFVEVDTRTLLLDRASKHWEPVGVSPIAIQPLFGHKGLELQEVRVYRGTSLTPVLRFNEQTTVLSLADSIPTFAPGDTLRVELEVANTKACPLFVFAHLVGPSNQTRIRLMDDGSGPDAAAGDGTFSGRFVVPFVQGVENVAIDILDPAVFGSTGAYRANGLGMNIQVQGGSPAPSPTVN